MPRKITIEAKHMGGGFNLSAGDKFTKEEECVYSQHMEFTPEGSAVTSLGWAAYDSWNFAEDGHGIDGLQQSNNYPDLLFAALNGKIKYVSSTTATPYSVDAGLSLTVGSPVLMREYRGQMYFCNGVDNLGRIAIGKLSAELTTTPSDSTVSLRTTAYEWEASAQGTNEYYLQVTGGGQAAISEPTSLLINGIAATKGSVTSLTAGRWAWGNSDNLGYQTVYVRLSDGTDPDTKAADYVQAVFADIIELEDAEGYKFYNTFNSQSGTLAAEKVYIEGDEIDYQGVTGIGFGDELYVASNIATTHPAGAYVTQYNSLSSGEMPPTGSVKAKAMAFWRDTLWIGGMPDEPNVLRYGKTISSVGDIATGEIHDFSDGENYLIGEGGQITALQSTRDRLYVCMKDRIHYITTEFTSSGTLTFSPDRLFSGNYGCPNQFCIAEMEDVVVVYTGKRVIRIGYLPGSDQVLPDEKFDEEIYPILATADADQTNARVVYFPAKKELRVTFMVNGILRTAKYNYRLDKWSYPDDTDVGCYAVYKDRLYFGDPLDDNVFRFGLDIDANGAETPHMLKTGRQRGDSTKPMTFVRGYVEGKKSEGCTINMVTSIGGNDFGGVRRITDAHANLGPGKGTALGDLTVGAETVGGDAAGVFLYDYKYPFVIRQLGNDIQLRWSTLEPGAVWTVDKWHVEGIGYDQIPSTHY